MSKTYCRYCLEVDPTVVSSWDNGSHSLEISGCYNCHERHEKQITDLQAELTSLRAAFAKRKADHEIEVSRKEAESSVALIDKKAKCDLLELEVNKLKAENKAKCDLLHLEVNKLRAENRHQRRKVDFLAQECKSLLQRM
ncbi:unnamed protein product [Calypogeia fissa]